MRVSFSSRASRIALALAVVMLISAGVAWARVSSPRSPASRGHSATHAAFLHKTSPSGVRVSGPIPTTATSHPFVTGGVDLPAAGYRLDEYFVSGKANVYDWGPTGNASTPQVRTPDAPYTTRITVRHPVDSRRFSGNVWVELSNPSRNYDVDVEWGSVHSKFIRDGDIVVEVTSKRSLRWSSRAIELRSIRQ